MPFFLKPCLKLRRKKKKSQRKKDFQTCNDVTSQVTNTEIWQQYPSASENTLNEELEENNDNINTVSSFRLTSEIENISPNDNSNIDTNESNSQNAPTDETGKSKKSDLKCHVVVIENMNSLNVKKETKCEQQNDEISSEITGGVNIENIKPLKDVCEEMTNAIPSAGDLVQLKQSAGKSSPIISDITVTSNVFDAIKEIKANEVSAIHEDHNILNSKDDDELLDRKVLTGKDDSDVRGSSDDLQDPSFTFVSEDNCVSVNKNLEIAKENEQYKVSTNSTGFVVTEDYRLMKNDSRNEIISAHDDVKTKLIENNYCIPVNEGIKPNKEDETNAANETQQKKSIIEDKSDVDSVSSTDVSNVSSKSEYKSFESISTTQGEVSPVERVLKFDDNITNITYEDYNNTTESQFERGDINPEDTYDKTEHRNQFPVKVSSVFTEANKLPSTCNESDIDVIEKTDNFSHKILDSEISEPLDCPHHTIGDSRVNISEASSHGIEKENTFFSSDEEIDTDVSTLLQESIEFINALMINDYDANLSTVSDSKRMASNLTYTMDESSTNSHTDETESVASKLTTNANMKCKHSNAAGRNLESSHQSNLPQQTTEFATYPDSEYSCRCVHNHNKAVPETDIYNPQAEYCSDESEEQLVLDDSESERKDDENLYTLCSLHAAQDNLRDTLCEESFRCHKKTSNLICFHEEFPSNHRMVCCHKDTGIRNNDISREKYDVLNEIHDHTSKKKVGKSMKAISEEHTKNVHGNYLTTNKIHNLKDIFPFSANNNTISSKKENEAVKEKAKESDEYLHFKINREEKSLNKYRLPSPSGSSDLSDTGDIGNVGRKKSGSFIMSACGDNKIINERLLDGPDSYELPHQTTHETSGNDKIPSKRNDHFFTVEDLLNFGKENSKKDLKSMPSPVLNNLCANATIELENIFGYKTDFEKLSVNEEMLKLKNEIERDSLNEIENCIRETMERFKKRKMKALSVMKPDMRYIPIKKIQDFKSNCCRVESFSLPKHEDAESSSVMQKTSSMEKMLDDFFGCSLRQGKKHSDTKLASRQKKIKNKLRNHEAYSSDSNIDYSSDSSAKMTPNLKQVLDISRGLRSPKYPSKNKKKATSNSVLYRTRPIIIKPSKLNLVAYLTKGENNVYQIKQGYRVSSPVPRKCNAPLEGNTRGRDFDRLQSHHTVNNRATSPHDLKMKFDDQFRKYASRGRPNGELMSYKRSTEWLKEAGIIGKGLTTEEANDAFKCVAGVKVALNRGDYRNFLKKLTRLKKLNYNEIYEKLCSAANKYEEE